MAMLRSQLTDTRDIVHTDMHVHTHTDTCACTQA